MNTPGPGVLLSCPHPQERVSLSLLPACPRIWVEASVGCDTCLPGVKGGGLAGAPVVPVLGVGWCFAVVGFVMFK